MYRPPIPKGPGQGPTYRLEETLLASALVGGGLLLVVAMAFQPVIGALLVAGAMVTRRLVEEIRDAQRQFPNEGERLCVCIPRTDHCLHI